MVSSKPEMLKLTGIHSNVLGTSPAHHLVTRKEEEEGVGVVPQQPGEGRRLAVASRVLLKP